MADIDFITDLSNGGFVLSLTGNPQKVTGNRALLNRFEVTFLTKIKRYLYDGETYVNDNYGGNADVLISNPQVINDPQGIVSTISIAIERTVSSMVQDQGQSIPPNEKISTAKLLNIYIQNDTIMAQIEVFPVEVDTFESLVSNLPVIKR